jgi:hypothetical protein
MRDLEKTEPRLIELSRQYDIFVVSSSAHRKLLRGAAWAKAVSFIEDDDLLKTVQEATLKLDGGDSLLQWQKLGVALSLVSDREKLTGYKYETIVRIRSDIPLERVAFAVFESLPNNTLAAQSDIIFGGRRDAMMVFDGFFDYAIENFWMNSKYRKLDWGLVSEWDPLAAAQHRLLLPVLAFSELPRLALSKKLLKILTGPGHGLLGTNRVGRKIFSKILKNIHQGLSRYPEAGQGVPVDVDDGNNFFPSERSFATFAALNGLKLKAIKPFIAPFRFRHSRHRKSTLRTSIE